MITNKKLDESWDYNVSNQGCSQAYLYFYFKLITRQHYEHLVLWSKIDDY